MLHIVLMPAFVHTGKMLQSNRTRGRLQVRSAAAEAVKVYEKEHKLDKSHKLKVITMRQ